SLIRRVVNNVNIVVNNLILKYVEDDIVLSVNITSAECYTVDDMWERAFMDITAPELVLRKVINFADCTVCLDKRNASGKIEFYQDPLLYKCSFRTRLHFTYDNINSKIPSVIKIQTMVESLKLSITDQQLPMFIRILQLIIALYYGEIGGHKEGEGEEGSGHVREAGANLPGAMSVHMLLFLNGTFNITLTMSLEVLLRHPEDNRNQIRELAQTLMDGGVLDELIQQKLDAFNTRWDELMARALLRQKELEKSVQLAEENDKALRQIPEALANTDRHLTAYLTDHIDAQQIPQEAQGPGGRERGSEGKETEGGVNARATTPVSTFTA
ncbi:vacuolar protein sorting-associated protein 13B isoform X1, partial [Lates japonicus]